MHSSWQMIVACVERQKRLQTVTVDLELSLLKQQHGLLQTHDAVPVTLPVFDGPSDLGIPDAVPWPDRVARDLEAMRLGVWIWPD